MSGTKARPTRRSAPTPKATSGRLTGHTDQAQVVELEIQPLTTERFADLAELFNEGGDPKWCWCQYFRKQGLD